MARPETHADLPEHELTRRTGTVAVDLTDPASLRALADMIDAHRALGGTVAQAEYGDSVEFTRPTSTAELERALRTAQNSWDYFEKAWHEAVEQIRYPGQQYMRDSIDRWAKAEGRVAVDWPPLETASKETV